MKAMQLLARHQRSAAATRRSAFQVQGFGLGRAHFSTNDKTKTQVIFEGTDDTFDELVVESKVPVVVDVYANWCGPCKILTPLLEKEIQALNGKVKLVKIDSDDQPNLARGLRVSALPTVIAVHEGQAVDNFVGFPGNDKLKEFVQRLAKLGDK